MRTRDIIEPARRSQSVGERKRRNDMSPLSPQPRKLRGVLVKGPRTAPVPRTPVRFNITDDDEYFVSHENNAGPPAARTRSRVRLTTDRTVTEAGNVTSITGGPHAMRLVINAPKRALQSDRKASSPRVDVERNENAFQPVRLRFDTEEDSTVHGGNNSSIHLEDVRPVSDGNGPEVHDDQSRARILTVSSDQDSDILDTAFLESSSAPSVRERRISYQSSPERLDEEDDDVVVVAGPGDDQRNFLIGAQDDDSDIVVLNVSPNRTVDLDSSTGGLNAFRRGLQEESSQDPLRGGIASFVTPPCNLGPIDFDDSTHTANDPANYHGGRFRNNRHSVADNAQSPGLSVFSNVEPTNSQLRLRITVDIPSNRHNHDARNSGHLSSSSGINISSQGIMGNLSVIRRGARHDLNDTLEITENRNGEQGPGHFRRNTTSRHAEDEPDETSAARENHNRYLRGDMHRNVEYEEDDTSSDSDDANQAFDLGHLSRVPDQDNDRSNLRTDAGQRRDRIAAMHPGSGTSVRVSVSHRDASDVLGRIFDDLANSANHFAGGFTSGVRGEHRIGIRASHLESSSDSDSSIDEIQERAASVDFDRAARLLQEAEDYQLALRLAAEVDTGEVHSAGPSRRTQRRLSYRVLLKQRPLLPGQHCIICLEEQPSDPVGCIHCRQLLGCYGCIMKWRSTTNISELNRRSPLSMGCPSTNHRKCPLCRYEWDNEPEVTCWDELRAD